MHVQFALASLLSVFRLSADLISLHRLSIC